VNFCILICLGLLSVAVSPEKMAEITPSLNELVREHRFSGCSS
jgi:hypothetical protein